MTELLNEICDDPDDEGSDYGRGWEAGYRRGVAAGRKQAAEERAAKLMERIPNSPPETCSQVAIDVEAASVEQLRAEVARLDLRLRWMHDHYDNAGLTSMLAAYQLADERDAARSALAELVRLKDGPRDAAYERDKPLAWQRAREVLTAKIAEESNHAD